uniref:Ribonuclease H-like domain-containing protein n=1 Tax=Tanacetum cinerariifolium TaxID=118510 RepID=A0A6L2J697_TANCI|nr:ribonuclease H-like domain-containing protein [Tanacetum cinerariifolium]
MFNRLLLWVRSSRPNPAAPPGFLTGLADNTEQATTLPQAFTVRTLHDPTTDACNMDTCDFLTYRVLLLCDSTGDLYPVIAPSPIAHAFLRSLPLFVMLVSLANIWLPFVSFNTVVSGYKTRLVANINTQIEVVDVDETFSSVVKPGMSLSRKKYVVEILERADIVNCNSSQTHVDTKSKLVQQVCLHIHDPREPYLSALKRILRYVCVTLDYGSQLFSSSATDLIAYTDADWVGCPTTRRSTSDYYVFLDNNLLSCSSKRQPTFSRSSAEAEYRGVANVVAKTSWIRNLLR